MNRTKPYVRVIVSGVVLAVASPLFAKGKPKSEPKTEAAPAPSAAAPEAKALIAAPVTEGPLAKDAETWQAKFTSIEARVDSYYKKEIEQKLEAASSKPAPEQLEVVENILGVAEETTLEKRVIQVEELLGVEGDPKALVLERVAPLFKPTVLFQIENQQRRRRNLGENYVARAGMIETFLAARRKKEEKKKPTTRNERLAALKEQFPGISDSSVNSLVLADFEQAFRITPDGIADFERRLASVEEMAKRSAEQVKQVRTFLRWMEDADKELKLLEDQMN